ncbi:MAG: 50S ribosomal protein L25/general stress protein Ctc [Lysobacteraceae bacterium]
MSNHEIKVQRREDEGKGASRRLRRAGEVPAVVYGGGLNPVSIKLSHNDAWLASQHEWFYSSILDLSLNGDVQRVLLRDMQRHPFKQLIMHLDFQRVMEDELLTARVPLHFINQETSPAGKLSGVVITHELTEVEVTCLPKDLPENIEVDLSKLNVGDVMHLSQLVMPKGVSVAGGKLDKEHDIALVIARHARAEAEPAAEEGDEADNK